MNECVEFVPYEDDVQSSTKDNTQEDVQDEKGQPSKKKKEKSFENFFKKREKTSLKAC